MKEILIITKNINKWKIASDIFSKYHLILKQKEIETPEIQDYDVVNVSKFSAEYIADKLQSSVIKSDVGYYIEELGGFPGPYVRDINQMLSSEDILKMMEGKKIVLSF